MTGTCGPTREVPRGESGAQGPNPQRPDPKAPQARDDDPSARAQADVTCLLARAPGLRRLVELVEENGLNPTGADREDTDRDHRRIERR